MIKNPSENLRRGRRRIEEIPEISLLEDWIWDTVTKRFYLHINICLEQDSPDVPQITEWYVAAAASYPFGPLSIYPSCKNSITNTFPHQSINAFEEKNHLWRKGKLCVDLIDQTLGIQVPEKEPFTVDERLFWNMQRAILWLRAAAEGTLIKNGDAFELPDFPTSHIEPVFAFQEDSVSMMLWEDTDKYFGVARIVRKQLQASQSVAVIHSFRSIDSKKVIYQPAWGTVIGAIETCEDALWIRLNKVPVVNGWQAPVNLLDLKQVCTSQGIDLLDILKTFAPRARDRRPHLLLIGFPVPAHIGEIPCEMVWQAIELPVLSHGQYTNRSFHSGKRDSIPCTKGAAKGYRPGEAGWWANDKATILLDSMELSWIYSENWSARTIKGRGKLTSMLTNQHIAMIGLGSLGASIAELLTRAGAALLTCIDGNALEIGNLCRHTLSVSDLYQPKGKSVSVRLTNIDPNTRISYVDNYLSMDENGTLTPDLSCYDIIIDTTGEDQVLSLLSTARWKRKIVFCSSSVGLGAKRFYINIQRTCLPCFENFLGFVKPYFQQDTADCNLKALPRDGIGCWHPLFPARTDDMWLAACTTVKALESFVERVAEKGISLIYAVDNENELFSGLRLIEKNMNMSKIDNYAYYESISGIYGVKISSQKLQHLYDLCEKSYPYETGGILIGRYSDDLKWAEITEVTDAPIDSMRTLFSFIRSTQGIIALLKRAWKKQQYYLGEWHYHPSASPKPSGLDLKTMFRLSEDNELNCPEPVLLIIGGRQSDWQQYVGVYVKDQEIELHKIHSD